eukprot:TRINITY_DN25409_c0_g1_i1.p1 TRINITY_DN25409_c0_g1~~TRINITY_DN25409_c0_g1_i1.p1  ORF type:complete len:135 (-),score=24.80 TRINITY_DN25409_c0_g1_i1:317-721(-)
MSPSRGDSAVGGMPPMAETMDGPFQDHRSSGRLPKRSWGSAAADVDLDEEVEAGCGPGDLIFSNMHIGEHYHSSSLDGEEFRSSEEVQGSMLGSIFSRSTFSDLLSKVWVCLSCCRTSRCQNSDSSSASLDKQV